MGTDSRRYTTKEFPQSRVGEAKVISFKVPAAWRDLLDEAIARHPSGIANRTDAMQDALMKWLLLEGVE